MERILSDIRTECTGNRSPELMERCDAVLGSDESEATLEAILALFQACLHTGSAKLNLLSIDLLKVYVRQLDDSVKENTITVILKHFGRIFNGEKRHLISLELLAFIIEIGATFGNHLTMGHVVDIIELCHRQIKEYVWRDQYPNHKDHQTGSSLFLSFFAQNHHQNSNKTGGQQPEDKVLSAINLTAGQVCHYYVKNQIISKPASVTTTTQSPPPEESSRGSLIHLMLYLVKKLELKVHFFEPNWDNTAGAGTVPETIKVEPMFILIKTFNCFYLKCIHFILVTIPDAWRAMTNRLMDVIWKNLAPVLVHILVPSMVQQNQQQQRKPTQIIASSVGVGDQPPATAAATTTNLFGRGTEKLHLATPGHNQSLAAEYHRQERQQMFKISVQLLRLFGLEASMRPLLEALFYRIFLLPPLGQRHDSLVFMQEILKNGLFVSILICDPIGLFGPSISKSKHLDLVQIFMDAIIEASLCDNDPLLNQLSLTCLATLLNTLRSLTSVTGSADDTSSPILKMIARYVERNKWSFDDANVKRPQRSTATIRKQTASHKNISSIKDRICGYDLGSFERKHRNIGCTGNAIGTPSNASQRPKNLDYDFDFKDKLKGLISSVSSSRSDINEFHHQPSFHLSFEDFTHNLDERLVAERWNSDSKLNQDETGYFSRSRQKRLKEEESNSVFSAHGSQDDDSSSSIKTLSGPDCSDVEDNNDDDDDDDDDDRQKQEEEISRRLYRRNLLGADSSDQLCRFERLLARIFVRKLDQLLPDLVNRRNLLDESIQEFASNFCRDLYINLNRMMDSATAAAELIDLRSDELEQLQNYRHLFDQLFINADGIYITTYMTLLLNLKLVYRNYYSDDCKENVPITEKSFIDDIFNYHNTIYLSEKFLAEIYQCVLAQNLFGLADAELNKLPLVKFLLDVDILNRNDPEAFKLSEYVRLEHVVQRCPASTTTSTTTTTAADIGSDQDRNRLPFNLLVKRFCGQFWDQIMLCLRQGLVKRFTFQTMIEQCHATYVGSVCQVLGHPNKHALGQAKNSNTSVQVCLMLFEICDRIPFYHRMDTIYDLLHRYIVGTAMADHHRSNGTAANLTFNLKHSFSSNDLPDRSGGGGPVATAGHHHQQKHQTLSCIQVLALKTLLTSPIRIGCYCPRIWRNVLDLCKFVIDLENRTFRSSRSSLLSRARVSIHTILKSNSMMMNFATNDYDTSLHGDHYQNLFVQDQNAFGHFPGINEAEYSNFEQCFDICISNLSAKRPEIEPDSKEMEQIIEYLSLFVGQIFETIPLKCNLSLLNSFIIELCDYSKQQLVKLQRPTSSSSSKDATITTTTVADWSTGPDCKSLMLFRLVEVMLRFVRNGRPLLHFMKIWPVVSSHLVQASTHRDPGISNKSITSLHDIINAFLSYYAELDYFNFNESLFKPYEKLLRYEMCNAESQQELILYSICEFVEGASKEIRSGWKSIFKALKGLRLSMVDGNAIAGSDSDRDCSHHVQILTDTFEAFLRTDNMHVLVYASVDFLPCIFHLIRNLAATPTPEEDNRQEDQQHPEAKPSPFIVFLKCLQKFSKILRSLNEHESFGKHFHLRQMMKRTRLIDLERIKDSLAKMDDCQVSEADLLRLLNQPGQPEWNVRQSSPLQIWCLFLNEYASTICASHLEYRPMLLEVYFTLVQMVTDMNAAGQDDFDFSIYCFNHIDLPMVQTLLRETLDLPSEQMDECYIFLKSWLPVFSGYIIRFLAKRGGHADAADLLLKQTLLVYIECLNGDYHDLVSIVALSLIKNLVLSLYRIFEPDLWQTIIDAFKLAHQLTIHPLRCLADAFAGHPANLDSDLERIKIMTIRTTAQPEQPQQPRPSSVHCLRKRAQQIFGANIQPQPQPQSNRLPVWQESGQESSSQHTIIVSTLSGIQKSVSYNQFISQVHNHLSLLQIIASLLTFNIKPTYTDLAPFFYETTDEICRNEIRKQSNDNQIPLLALQSTQFQEICFFLRQSFIYATRFDGRPGLKYLLRHVCHLNLVPNLYQMSALVWVTRFAVIFFLSANAQYRNAEENLHTLEELFAEISNVYREKMEQPLPPPKPLEERSEPPIIIDGHTSEFILHQAVSPDRMARVMEDYRRTKIRCSETTGAKESTVTGNIAIQQDTAQLLFADREMFEKIWNDIIDQTLRLHISGTIDAFRFMLPAYQQLIKMMISTGSRHQRATIEWIDKLAENFLILTNTDS